MSAIIRRAEAGARLAELRDARQNLIVEILRIEGELSLGPPFGHGGRALSADDYSEWRRKAKSALSWKRVEAARIRAEIARTEAMNGGPR